MPTQAKVLKQRLLSKFLFSESRTRSKDHEWFKLQLPGLPLIVTKVSHGVDEINDSIEGKIARQLRVKHKFMKEMVDCTKSKDDYYKRVRDDPIPPWDVLF